MLAVLALRGALALDNGVSVLPPLGWSSWNSLRGGINEALIRAQADAMVASGMRDAGYTYVNIDDLWAAKDRAANGSLVPDPAKFPSGMAALADYVHSKKLKLGLYTDVGSTTCGGQPGSYGFECQDAATFAAWGVDWVKNDHCSPVVAAGGDLDGFYNQRLALMRNCLNGTGRRIHVDVCAHSCYNSTALKHSPTCWRQWYGNATRLGNSWRTTTDISDNWPSVLRNWYRNDQFQGGAVRLSQFAGPGHWNNPDSLVVGMGGGGLTADQERLHMSMWALMAAPLIAGNRLDTMTPATAAVLTNGRLLAVNQDRAGMQATRIQTAGARTAFNDVYGDPLYRYEREVWCKPLAPMVPGSQYGFALGLVNHGNATANVEAAMSAVASAFPALLPASAWPRFDSWEVWSNQSAGDVVPSDVVSFAVPPSGVAVITLVADC